MKRTGPGGRSGHRLAPTAAGQRLLDGLFDARRAALLELLEPLGYAERQSLALTLERLLAARLAAVADELPGHDTSPGRDGARPGESRQALSDPHLRSREPASPAEWLRLRGLAVLAWQGRGEKVDEQLGDALRVVVVDPM